MKFGDLSISGFVFAVGILTSIQRVKVMVEGLGGSSLNP